MTTNSSALARLIRRLTIERFRGIERLVWYPKPGVNVILGGFVEYLLERAINEDRLELGVWITDAGGNDTALMLLEGLAGSGLQFGGFADDEGRCPTRWADVRKKLGKLLFRWASGCLEENIIKLVRDDQLEDFVKDEDGESGIRLRTLAVRLDIKDKEFSTIRDKAKDLRTLIIEAATGVIPENKKSATPGEQKALKKHRQDWFKSIDGGRELAKKVFEFDLWPKLEKQLLPFLNAIRQAVELPEITELPP